MNRYTEDNIIGLEVTTSGSTLTITGIETGASWEDITKYIRYTSNSNKFTEKPLIRLSNALLWLNSGSWRVSPENRPELLKPKIINNYIIF